MRQIRLDVSNCLECPFACPDELGNYNCYHPHGEAGQVIAASVIDKENCPIPEACPLPKK